MNPISKLIQSWATLTGSIDAKIAELSEKDRRALALLSIVASGALLGFTLLRTYQNNSNAAKRIRLKTTQLYEAQSIAQGFAEAEAEKRALQSRLKQGDGRLQSVIEQVGQTSGLEIFSLNPKPETKRPSGLSEQPIDFNVSDVRIDKLVNFLQAIEEQPGMLRITNLRLEPKGTGTNANAWLTVTRFKLNEVPK